jgi:hypothetical protein
MEEYPCSLYRSASLSPQIKFFTLIIIRSFIRIGCNDNLTPLCTTFITLKLISHGAANVGSISALQTNSFNRGKWKKRKEINKKGEK